MDLQGTPIGHKSSTKVTNDPAANNTINEPSGPVAGDSLAAESATRGGGFSQNRGAQPMGVSGSHSTLNNKDTSAATKLPSAPVGTARENIHRQEKYPEALGGQGDFPGAHLPHSGYAGGPTGAKQQQQQQQQQNSQQHGTASASGSGYQSQPSNVGAAPSYVQDVVGDSGHKKPKGKNLQEGGFDAGNNASFTTDIGSENDPGRLATKGFQQKQAESGPDGTSAGRQKGVDNNQWYQHLQSDQRA
ncbi:hypothetical protein BDV25DRAFT_136440 [Aspergillus avenaceus]|uniref:Uncharacterized protein n=1 Tax=Aspergillus avenaceus TaxID=36643 RepID=A0A5N6U5G0_ASPAV|nr:hypothetical protein BDV25DRAFT_136440 [Aspergillus avenaceus]